MLALVIAAVAGTLSNHAVQAFTRDHSRGVYVGLDRIQFATPVLAPFAHARHCVQYPDECRVRRMAFRGGKLVLTEKRWAELKSIARSGPSAVFTASPARNG
jgi:predicted transglutaminase-like cysteine proteinase